MKKALLLLCFSFVFTFYTHAKTPWPPPCEPGNLSVTVVAASSDQYLKDWVNPEMKNKVTIKRLREIRVEQIAYCGFMITGLSPSSKGDGFLRYSVGFKLYGPNGSLLFHEPNFTKGKISDPGKPTYILADPALDLVLEESDPAGTYTLEGIVTDLATGKKATDEYQITLIKQEASSPSSEPARITPVD